MKRLASLAVLASALCLPAFAGAAGDMSGKPTPAEAPFVSAITADLTARFATPDAAIKAGYIRYTNEDDTGAISYANREWTSKDAAHPSQLWYDAHGRLLGADYSVPFDAGNPPKLFGVTPARWQPFHAHAHYGLVGTDGATVYGGIGLQKLQAADATDTQPSAAGLVAAGVAKKASDVKFVFTFPAIWDLGVWLVPNPSGAFAEKNPDVKPVNPKGMM